MPFAGPCLGFAALVVCASAATSRGAEPPAVVNARAMLPWVQKAQSGRADVVGLGDSNQIHRSDGWDHGWTRALSLKFGLYSTQILSPGENRGAGAGAGYTFSTMTALPSTDLQVGGVTQGLDVFMASGDLLVPLNYLYLPLGKTASSATNQGLYIERASPLDVNGALRFRVVHGVFGDGQNGTFQLAAKLAEPPWATIQASGVIGTGAESAGLAVSTLDLPAGQRNSALNFRFAPDGSPMTGPFVAFLMRAENVGRSSGAAFHTLYYKGLQSARDMAEALQAASDQYLSMYFGEVRALQGSPVRVMVRLNCGVNDRNEPLESLGPMHVLPGFSPAAFSDNLDAIMIRLRGIWALNGWDQGELSFLITVTHPIAAPEDPQLVEFRAVADALASKRDSVAVAHLERLTSVQEILANGWYPLSGFDRNHLYTPGYETLSVRELDAVISSACVADADLNGTVDTEDLVILLGQFGSVLPRWTGADTDGNGVIETVDLVNVLGVFGAGCGGGGGG